MGFLKRKKLSVPTEWVLVCGFEDFRSSKCFVHEGKEYALFKTEAGLFCTDNSCSHEYSPLCEGEVMEGSVYCPKHGSRFDLASGKVLSYPATEDVRTYEVKLEDEKVYVFL